MADKNERLLQIIKQQITERFQRQCGKDAVPPRFHLWSDGKQWQYVLCTIEDDHLSDAISTYVDGTANDVQTFYKRVVDALEKRMIRTQEAATVQQRKCRALQLAYYRRQFGPHITEEHLP